MCRFVHATAVLVFGVAGVWEETSASAAPLPGDEPTPKAAEFFEKEIRPLLVERCNSCHGAKGAPKSGLDLTTRDGVLRGGDSGPAAVEGKPDESLLIRAVRYHDEPRMPPRKRLSEPEIGNLTRWVEMGMPWPSSTGAPSPPSPGADARPATITPEQRAFWSFQPVVDRPVPAVRDAAWPVTSIDRFVLAKMEEKDLIPASVVDKRTLIRRATFDLTGLPPTPEAVASFLNDSSADAFARVVDRLLASSAYGERWGRHWLDLAHYSDTAGETADFPVPQAYRYRNYVVDAFNQDKPYDQFVREQLAGDLMAAGGPRELYAERTIATGFLAVSRRFGFDPQNYHHLTIEDTIDVFGKTFLGLTLACARCHNHKFDPISSADYYALYGIFESSRYPFPGSEEKKAPRDFAPLLPPVEVDALVKPFQEKLAACDAELKAAEAPVASVDQELKLVAERLQAASQAKDTFSLEAEGDKERQVALTLKRAALAEPLEAIKKRRQALLAQAPAIDLAYAMAEGTPKNAHIQRRGDPKNVGPEVARRIPQIFGGLDQTPVKAGSGRLMLAEWLTDRSNPLTARVMVNRIWQHHFGRGLVATPSNYGKQGQPPSHPELLDWLASRFVEDGWSIKAMHRRIMLSKVYQISCEGDPRGPERDPENVWLSRSVRRRLSAESIRDAILAVSGDLEVGPGGTHPFPPKEAWGFTQHNPFQAVYETKRRSIYLMTQRTRRHPFLALFDGSDPNASTDRRNVTTVPTQALFFLNNPFVHEQSAKFAVRLMREEADDAHRAARAHALAFGRPPTLAETKATADYVRAVAEAQPAGTPEDARASAAWASLARTLFASNEFLYVD